MIDLHSHILPAMDDGSTNWEQSLEMARMAAEDGIQAIVCTPHFMTGSFENRRIDIIEMVNKFKERLAEKRISLELYPGAELRLELDLGDRIQSGEILTINDTGRYALIELPPQVLPPNLDGYFWDLLSRGITPIVAHPERHGALIRDATPLLQWVKMGTLSQVTAASLTGRFGKPVQKFCVELIEHRLAHILSTDCHGTRARRPHLFRAYQEAQAVVGESRAKEMIQGFPERIIRGESIATPPPVPLEARRPGQNAICKLLSLFGRRVSVQ